MKPDAPSPAEPAPPECVGPYRIEKKLGAGGMGAVYRAWDERLERWVAIKHILPDVAEDPKIRQRLRREARAVASLNHPAIVQIFDIVEMEEGDWIVMEFLDGESLRRLVKEGQIDWVQAARVARTVAEGLSEAHLKGIVHRDLKTENVMVLSSGVAKILDFGLAKRLVQGPQDTALSIQGTILGTGRAMSPEQAKGDPVDHRSDLFSLGTLIYESVTGKAPFLGQSIVHTLTQVCTERQQPAHEVNPRIPQELSELIDRLLEKSPDRRPQSAIEVAVALGNIVGLSLTESSLTRSGLDGTTASDSQLSTCAWPVPRDSDSSTRVVLPSTVPETRTARIFDERDAVLSPSGSAAGSGTYPSVTQVASWASPRGSVSSLRSAGASGIAVKTLLVVDLIDAQHLGERFGVERSFEVLALHDRLVRGLLAQFDAVEVHKTDSFLLLFERPVEAVRYALAYHDRLAGLAEETGIDLKGRIAIHLGEVFLHENTVDEVNRGARRLEVEGLTKLVTARVASLAGGGQTLLTQAAYDMSHRALVDESMTGEEFRWQAHGLYGLDGVEESVRVYEVSPMGIAPLQPPSDSEHARRAAEEVSSMSSFITPGRSNLVRRLLALAAALVAVGALYFARGPGGRGGDAGRASVAVLGFRNLTERAEDAWYSTALAEMLSIELATGGQLRLVPGESVARFKKDGFTFETDTLAADTLARVGKGLDTDYVILGSYFVLGQGAGGKQLKLLLQLQDTRRGESVTSISKTGGEERFFELVSEAGSELRAKLGAGEKTNAEAAALRAALPSTTEATRLYAEGLERFRTYDASSARDRLREAVRLDPDYALAHAALSRAWLALGDERKAQASAELAWELAQGLPREERLWIEGLRHEMSFDWGQAVSTYNALRRFYPESVEYGLRLAWSQGMAGFTPDARATLEGLRSMPKPAGDDPRIDLLEADLLYWLSDYSGQLAAAGEAAKKAGARGSKTLLAEGRLHEGSAFYYLGRPDEAEKAWGTARELFAEIGDAGKLAEIQFRVARVYHDRGELDRADASYREALAAHRSHGNRKREAEVLHILSYLLFEWGELAEARIMIDDAVAISRDLGDRHSEFSYCDSKIWYALHQNDLRTVEELAEAELRFGEEIGNDEWTAWSYFYLGRAALARGELDRSREHYDKMAVVGRGRLLAYQRCSQAELLLAQGDLRGAEKALQEVVSILGETGDRESLVQSQLVRVELLLEQGRNAECAAEARRLATELRQEGRREAMIEATTTYVRALMREGEIAVAREALDGIEAEIERSEVPAVRLAARIARARLLAATGDFAAALRESEATVEEVRLLELAAVEFEARLALGEIEIRGGGTSSVGETGQKRLRELAEEARTLGFEQIARRALEALESS